MKKDIFPNGVEVVVSGLVRKGDKLLLAKSPKWSHTWITPGGHIEPGETIREAAQREVLEEVGLNTRPIQIYNSGERFETENFDRPAHFIYFDVLLDFKNGQVKIDEEEISEYGWFTVDEALKLELLDCFIEKILAFSNLK